MNAATRQTLFINLAHGLTHYCLLILATAVLRIIAQDSGHFGSEYGPVLALGTGMFVVYGLGSLPMAWCVARLGARRMLLLFFLGTGLAMMAAGFTTTSWQLAAALTVMGAFAAIYHPVGTTMLVETAGKKVGRIMGVNGASGNIGVALAPIVTGLLAQFFGWRYGFWLPGALCVLIGVAFAFSPEPDQEAAHRARREFPEIPRWMVRRAVVVLMLIAATSGLVFNAFTLLLPALMAERLASAPGLLPVVGALAFLATLCGGLTQFTIGRMIDRTTLKRVFLPLALIPLPAMLLLAVLHGPAVLLVAALMAAAIFGQVTVNETMGARYVAPALRTKLYSIRFFVGFLGAAVASPLVGYLHDLTGNLGLTCAVLAGFSVVTLLCALGFPNRQEELHPEQWARLVGKEEGHVIHGGENLAAGRT